MPLIRKVIQIGTSKGVTLPKSWLEFYKEKTGQEIKEVTIEVNSFLKIQPYTKHEEEEEIV